MIEVSFDEEKHKYTELANPDKEYISVTTLIHKYVQPFDKEFWGLYKAYERAFPDDFSDLKRIFLAQKTKEIIYNHCDDKMKVSLIHTYREIQDEWKKKNKEACDKGTAFHKLMEEESYKKGKVIENEYEIPVIPFSMDLDLRNLNPGLYPELTVYCTELAIGGKIDEPYILPNGTFNINDYKTNKELKFNNKFQKMLFPLNHLDDCSWNHYQIQLSLYAYLLNKISGLKIGELALLYEGERLPFKYMKREVENMLLHYSSNKKK